MNGSDSIKRILDRINQPSPKLRRGRQDIKDFFITFLKKVMKLNLPSVEGLLLFSNIKCSAARRMVFFRFHPETGKLKTHSIL